MFEKYLKRSFSDAWEWLIAEHVEDTLRHVNESVFRYMMLRKLLAQKPTFTCHDEWHRIDLLLAATDQQKQAAVEFKFYDARPIYSIDGKVIGCKGGPGEKNRSEFKHSIDLLKKLDTQSWYTNENANITDLYVVLIGADRTNESRPRSRKFSEYCSAANVRELEPNLSVLDSRSDKLGRIDLFGWIALVR